MKHLFIIGGGSAAATAAFKAHSAGWQVTLANEGLPIGGTCLNVGCVPSKFFIRAAQIMHESQHPRYDAIAPAPRSLDWPTLVAEKQTLVDELRARNYEQSLPTLDNLEWVKGRARFVDAHTIQVGEQTWQPDKVLIATGASTLMPPIDGLTDTPFLTNDTIYDLPALPRVSHRIRRRLHRPRSRANVPALWHPSHRHPTIVHHSFGSTRRHFGTASRTPRGRRTHGRKPILS